MFGRRKKDGGGGGGNKDKGRNSEDELLKVSCEGGQAGRGRRVGEANERVGVHRMPAQKKGF